MTETVDEMRERLEAVMTAVAAANPGVPTYDDADGQIDLVVIDEKRAS